MVCGCSHGACEYTNCQLTVPRPTRSLSDSMRDSVPFHFPFRPVDHGQWMRFRIEYPLVERDEVVVRKQ
jgi:hypothetical protein